MAMPVHRAHSLPLKTARPAMNASTPSPNVIHPQVLRSLKTNTALPTKNDDLYTAIRPSMTAKTPPKASTRPEKACQPAARVSRESMRRSLRSLVDPR